MTASTDFFESRLGQHPVMAILRGHGVEQTLELCTRAWDAGIELVEVPVQRAEDWTALEQAVAAGRARDRYVGAGTVVAPEFVTRVADVGAAFTVAPGFDAEIASASHAAGLAHLPGVATATEVHAATRAGLTWLKAFPASVLGAGWFAAMRGPFPGTRFVATGGVDVANARELLTAGAAAVSLGSAFANADAQALRDLVGGTA